MADEVKTDSQISKGRPTFLERLAERLAIGASAEAVYGEAVERDGISVIPVARARWAFGGGGGSKGADEGSGGGGAVLVSPLGYIELKNGSSEFRPIRDPSAMVPLILAGGFISFLLLRNLFRRMRS